MTTDHTPKPPTASGISRLLAKAGHKRSVVDSWRFNEGYRVTKDGNRNAVRVRHLFWSMGATPEQHAAKLAAYAKTITEAGWTVEAGTYELIVTAKPEDSPSLAAKDPTPEKG